VNVQEMQARLGLGLAAGGRGLERKVSGGYCGDLLSDVMANARHGDVWLTIQCHPNIVAVALLREIAAIVLVNGRTPDPDTKERAEAEAIPLLLCEHSAFELAGRLREAGIAGRPG
jgi:predicted transcriptional regulator